MQIGLWWDSENVVHLIKVEEKASVAAESMGRKGLCHIVV